MTPEEKAKELVEKFYEYSQDVGRTRYNSKQCAIICVDEIIEVLAPFSWNPNSRSHQEYWQQVKTAIQSL